MKNLLNSTDIATLFLDADLNVRRFTTRTTRIIKLIPSDAGRPITDITSDLDYPALAEDAREVLHTLVFKEKLVTTHDGRWFAVRIMPYRTLENLIDGIVITFSDASASRTLDSTLKDQASQLQQMADSLPTLVWGARADGTCEYVNRQWSDYTGLPAAGHYGYGWVQQVHDEERERVREAWLSAVASGAPFQADLRLRRADGAYRWFKARSVPIRDGQGQVVKWYGTNTDVDDLKGPSGGARD
jgi:two-component system CheB/CheR fusion protein